MFEKELSARPNIEQYKKQAKDLARDCAFGIPAEVARLARHHPRFHKLPESELGSAQVNLTDAQLVIAREHGFESWPQFARHIETLRLIRSVHSLTDPVGAFIKMACVPRHADHGSGTLEHAEMILSRYPQVAARNIYTAAILGDEAAVRGILSRDPKSATAKGGPHRWDALTYLCFSRYLRLHKLRSNAFLRSARALLDAGASANTGWTETIDHPLPRTITESAIYGAAAVARHPELTRLLLERGADPNDEETPYHVPESFDNTVMKVLLDSGKLNATSLSWMLVRKADWHDEKGMRLVLEHGGDPTVMTRWGFNAMHQAVRRDNALSTIELLLNYGADPNLRSVDGRSAAAISARRGRGDGLKLFEERQIPRDLQGVDQLIAACARADREGIRRLVAREPHLREELVAEGGTLLSQFAGVGNLEGVRCLLDLGVSPAALYEQGDAYFEIAKESTALHVAAWRGWPAVVKELIELGTPVNAVDARGRTALVLAVKACVDSYWTNRRSPESVDSLLRAGASITGVEVPSGYDEVDELLGRYISANRN